MRIHAIAVASIAIAVACGGTASQVTTAPGNYRHHE